MEGHVQARNMKTAALIGLGLALQGWPERGPVRGHYGYLQILDP